MVKLHYIVKKFHIVNCFLRFTISSIHCITSRKQPQLFAFQKYVHPTVFELPSFLLDVVTKMIQIRSSFFTLPSNIAKTSIRCITLAQKEYNQSFLLRWKRKHNLGELVGEGRKKVALVLLRLILFHMTMGQYDPDYLTLSTIATLSELDSLCSY